MDSMVLFSVFNIILIDFNLILIFDIQILLIAKPMKKDDKKVANPLQQIKMIEQKRQERRVKMQQAKKEKEEKKAYNLASGKNVDIDFQIMIEKNKFNAKMLSEHVSSADLKLAVCVRKRPIFKKEQANGEIDSISCANPQIKIHQPKYKVDGITKYVQNHTFTFDNTFNQQQETTDIYKCSLKPLIPLLFNDGIVTCFAYGQTGSGKTYTMNDMQVQVVNDIFDHSKKGFNVSVSFFQIYGGRCLDLLNDKNLLNILQDKNMSIQIPGLTERLAGNAKQLLSIMEIANSSRTTHATVANDTSSRSHAICQVTVKSAREEQVGKLVLVDLAGSQRAQDTQSNNRQRRMQGAQINKSLLALKQCIRAMDQKADHVPFRASKLTLILRDSFLAKQNKSKIIMIACVSPGSSSADHSLNTLRYADRLKDNTEMHEKFNQMVENNKKSESLEVKKENFKQQIHKIESSKNIMKKEDTGRDNKDNDASLSLQNQKNQNKNGDKADKGNYDKADKIDKGNNNNEKGNKNETLPQNSKQTIPPSKAPPKINTIKKEQQKPEKPEKAPMPIRKEQKKGDRSNSIKKTIGNPNNNGNNNKSISHPKNSGTNNHSQENQIAQQIQIEDFIKEDKIGKQKVKDDISAMKRTMKNENKEEYFAFQQKVTNILQEQEQVFATHMAAIKQDAKLLTQQSQLISTVQGVGFIDYDIDSYVEKLESVIKKKLKMYNLLSKKVQNFKKYLKEEEQIRHKVKDTFYY